MNTSQQLTPEQLDAFIEARLALAGVDLGQLPDEQDEESGAPGRAQTLAALRSFVASTPGVIAGWLPPATGEWADALAQQASPPLEYPSITAAWTGELDGDKR